MNVDQYDEGNIAKQCEASVITASNIKVVLNSIPPEICLNTSKIIFIFHCCMSEM